MFVVLLLVLAFNSVSPVLGDLNNGREVISFLRNLKQVWKQAGAELCQAQEKLGLAKSPLLWPSSI